jgi:2-oxoisovalerate dehydrogenase E2 component (dihydrolipoyl transacylase)
MSRFVFKMPDLGEGTVEAEVVAVHVKPGDVVKEEQIIFDVMTEKATVEVPSPVSGRIVSIAGKAGESLPVGAELIVFETDATQPESAPTSNAPTPVQPINEAPPPAHVEEKPKSTGRVMASPATRRRAREAGVELTDVQGSGPGGRILREDFDSFVDQRTARPRTARSFAHTGAEVEEIPVIGIRRVIAQRMTQTVQTIPHFTYVEEIDVTELEALRLHLNTKVEKGAGSYTYLPFFALALARVLPDFPQCNVRYDTERNVLLRHRSLHLGIATQTNDGLKVPVVRNVERRTLAEVAAEIRRVSEAARTNKATREELSGSTMTLTSLGKLGGIASTPIINAPEVAILGVNKAVERPVVIRGAITVRRMMNLSGSFDHRFVDGHDAASMIQALKECLEHPATIFMREV